MAYFGDIFDNVINSHSPVKTSVVFSSILFSSSWHLIIEKGLDYVFIFVADKEKVIK